MMWQIGIDVLSEYRQQGIATALTAALAKEILKRDKVPFYSSAWSNVRSVRNGIKSGFIPAWVAMTVPTPRAFSPTSNVPRTSSHSFAMPRCCCVLMANHRPPTSWHSATI